MQQKIRDFFNKGENWKYWFTSSRILKEVGGSQITVSRALGKLSRQGYLLKEMCKLNNKNRPIPIYTLDMMNGCLERLEDENLEEDY